MVFTYTVPEESPTPPQRSTDKPFPWAKELVLQNVVKRVVVRF
jgi:hypothetical protein